MRRGIYDLTTVKDRINAIKGKDVDITINRGRKKLDRYMGVIDNVYPSVFTVKILDSMLIKSVTCSYCDVLCGDVLIEEK